MNYRTWSARAAIAFGPLIIILVLGRNWGAWEAWPYWLDDIVAAIALIVAAYFAIETDNSTNSRALTGAWGFATATLWISMFRLMERTALEDPVPVWLITLSLVAFLGAVVGVAASIPSKRVIGGGGGAKSAAKPASRSRSKSRSSSKSSAG